MAATMESKLKRGSSLHSPSFSSSMILITPGSSAVITSVPLLDSTDLAPRLMLLFLGNSIRNSKNGS